jgi:hypothetical protein
MLTSPDLDQHIRRELRETAWRPSPTTAAELVTGHGA